MNIIETLNCDNALTIDYDEDKQAYVYTMTLCDNATATDSVVSEVFETYTCKDFTDALSHLVARLVYDNEDDRKRFLRNMHKLLVQNVKNLED